MRKDEVLKRIAEILPDEVPVNLVPAKKSDGVYGIIKLDGKSRTTFQLGTGKDAKTAEGQPRLTLIFGQASAPGKFVPKVSGNMIDANDWAKQHGL